MRYRPSDYTTLPDAAKEIGCSRQTVYRLIDRGTLAGVQLSDNGYWKVQRKSLTRYLERLASGRRRKG